jgi:hypothetical protein
MTFDRIQRQPIITQAEIHGIAAYCDPLVADQDTNGFLEDAPWQIGLIAEVVNFNPPLNQFSLELSSPLNGDNGLPTSLRELLFYLGRNIHDTSVCFQITASLNSP